MIISKAVLNCLEKGTKSLLAKLSRTILSPFYEMLVYSNSYLIELET